ncbi:MAG: hypothetical protein F6K10_20870 [Moorea sp. SIO2B7]|nr:hypothetical protein [Moorena sp. SIO2B7]
MYKPKDLSQRFNSKDVYPCPVCRHGKIEPLTLMEAFACNFCNHIFTANLEQQLLKMADSQFPLTWCWNGRTWRGLQREGVNLGWGYGVAAIAFVLLPPSLVGLSAYLFPPLPGSRLFWLPTFWIGLTFLCHLACLGWLVVEYYQFPVWMYLGAMRRQFLSR